MSLSAAQRRAQLDEIARRGSGRPSAATSWRERRAKLDEIARRREPGRLNPVHRRAVLAGAPSSTADPNRLEPRLRRAGMVVTRQHVFAEAKRAGAKRVTFAHPGCEGHESCRDICITYG